MIKVKNADELMQAVMKKSKKIVIMRNINMSSSFILDDGMVLTSEKQENNEFPILFFQNSDGVGVTSNNSIQNLVINAPLSHKAIFLISTKKDLGSFDFSNLTMTGQFSFITRSANNYANLSMKNIVINAADSRMYLEQPQKYGVNVLQGALTVYNFNSNPDSTIDANIDNVAIGNKNNPVIGSGIFIGGFGDKGGRVNVKLLKTSSVYSTGKIPFGAADFITAGVFISTGAHAKKIIHNGEIVTYGVNDMVLDAWGSVDTWEVNAPVISYGPSGVGFVNFGIVKKFTMNAPIETYGLGARGYNQYDGSLENGTFQSITTYGDGSVGIQISKQVGNIVIKKDIKTHGGIGNTLVKGANVQLPAYAFSVINGGKIKSLLVEGDVVSNGKKVVTFRTEDEVSIDKLEIKGKIIANGEKSKPTDINKKTVIKQKIIK